MRDNPDFNDGRYAEPPQTGRSHIRSQMLSDFFSLLNHDLEYWRDLSLELYGLSFVEQRSYDELSDTELEELDKLAVVMSGNPSINELVRFYLEAGTMQSSGLDQGSYCFVKNS